jgi:predicted methyltransferase MtxX (methanogen marker protein 4)
MGVGIPAASYTDRDAENPDPAILTGGGSCQLSRERALDRNSKQGLLAENLAWQQD